LRDIMLAILCNDHIEQVTVHNLPREGAQLVEKLDCAANCELFLE
jgi:hypothetical protein